MGRLMKIGLDFFPLEVTYDIKYKLMIAKYGLRGIGFIDSLYREIYKEGYFLTLEQNILLLLASDLKESEEELEKMLEFSIEIGFFCKEIYEEFSVLTSKGIQRRFTAAIVKRKQVVFLKHLLLIKPEVPDWSKTEIIISDSNKNLKESEISHSKEQYSKEQYSKEQHSKGEDEDYSENRAMEDFIYDSH